MDMLEFFVLPYMFNISLEFLAIFSFRASETHLKVEGQKYQSFERVWLGCAIGKPYSVNFFRE